MTQKGVNNWNYHRQLDNLTTHIPIAMFRNVMIIVVMLRDVFGGQESNVLLGNVVTNKHAM